MKDPGCVVHQAVGNVHTMLVAVDDGTGKDAICYSGPVFSHYEFTLKGVDRKSDSEWRKDLREHKQPQHPPWTSRFLVPGRNEQTEKFVHKDDPKPVGDD